VSSAHSLLCIFDANGEAPEPPISPAANALPEALIVRWILPLLLALNVGCIGVDITGIDGFSASSAHWVVAADGNLATHSLRLSDSANYCADLQSAEQERIDATARHQTRIDDGTGLCESTDLFYDDLATASANLDYDGAQLLTLVLDNGEELSEAARTAPMAGTYKQRGSAENGRFSGDVVYRNGSSAGGLAEAYTCEDPTTVDLDLLSQFQETEEVDLVDRWTMDAGEVSVVSGGDDAWDITVSADLLDGGENSVGTISTSFSAARCEVVAAN
jgi:hypothetical protein